MVLLFTKQSNSLCFAEEKVRSVKISCISQTKTNRTHVCANFFHRFGTHNRFLKRVSRNAKHRVQFPYKTFQKLIFDRLSYLFATNDVINFYLQLDITEHPWTESTFILIPGAFARLLLFPRVTVHRKHLSQNSIYSWTTPMALNYREEKTCTSRDKT